jgi:Trk-type K+ transport system membrane component
MSDPQHEMLDRRSKSQRGNITATWLMSLAMLIGRLEVFPLLLLFLPDFWK